MLSSYTLPLLKGVGDESGQETCNHISSYTSHNVKSIMVWIKSKMMYMCTSHPSGCWYEHGHKIFWHVI